MQNNIFKSVCCLIWSTNYIWITSISYSANQERMTCLRFILFLSNKANIQKAIILSYIFVEKVLDLVVIIFVLFIIAMSGYGDAELMKILIF